MNTTPHRQEQAHEHTGPRQDDHPADAGWKPRSRVPRLHGSPDTPHRRSILKDKSNTKFLITLGAVELFLLVGLPLWWWLGWVPGWAAISGMVAGVILLYLAVAAA